MDYRYGSHTVYQIEYHFVWVTKYRYKVLYGEVALRLRELVRQICEAFEIRIVKGVVSADHVHILVSAPPELSPSDPKRHAQVVALRKSGHSITRTAELAGCSPSQVKRIWAVEVSQAEAARMGAFCEDALTEADAMAAADQEGTKV